MMQKQSLALLTALLLLTSCLFSEETGHLSAVDQASATVGETAVSPTLPAATTATPLAHDECERDAPTQEMLNEITNDTWTYLSSDETTSNHLPHSWYSPDQTGGDFANPAEIGLYALSWLAAYDWQASWSPCWDETEAEITAVLTQLRAWQTGSQTEQPHGPNAYQNKVFYQWYWVNQDPPVLSGNDHDHLVPSIDNAWLAVSLITIREYAQVHGHSDLEALANQILGDMDFRLWYYPDTHLFSWGGVEDPLDTNNPNGPFVADVYSNENRLTNFVARAMAHLTREEFEQSIAALTVSDGIYGDIVVEKVAFDGSYFTYTSPTLFIREMETSYGYKTINPATAAQIQYAQDEGYDVWGLSDSYDVGLNGYVQQGAKPALTGDPVEIRPGLITPHVSALALITKHQKAAITNLEDIRSMYACSYDERFGFFDSVQANPNDIGYGQCSQRFTVLAQEWIFLSLANNNNQFIWNYFYRDNGVQQAYYEMFFPYRSYLPLALTSN